MDSVSDSVFQDASLQATRCLNWLPTFYPQNQLTFSNKSNPGNFGLICGHSVRPPQAHLLSYKTSLDTKPVLCQDRFCSLTHVAELGKLSYIHMNERVGRKLSPSNGSWCMGIKGEMSHLHEICIYIYIYELFIAFVSFVVCSLL